MSFLWVPSNTVTRSRTSEFCSGDLGSNKREFSTIVLQYKVAFSTFRFKLGGDTHKHESKILNQSDGQSWAWAASIGLVSFWLASSNPNSLRTSFIESFRIPWSLFDWQVGSLLVVVSSVCAFDKWKRQMTNKIANFWSMMIFLLLLLSDLQWKLRSVAQKWGQYISGEKNSILLGQYDDDDDFLEKLSKFRVGHFPEIFHSREREFPKKICVIPGNSRERFHLLYKLWKIFIFWEILHFFNELQLFSTLILSFSTKT